MPLYEDIQASVKQLIESYKLKAADGLTFSEATKLFTEAIGEIVKILQTTGGTGAEKRAAAIQAAQAFYDNVLAPIDIPGIPNLIVEPIVDKTIGGFIPAIVGGLIDGMVQVFKLNGVKGFGG